MTEIPDGPWLCTSCEREVQDVVCSLVLTLKTIYNSFTKSQFKTSITENSMRQSNIPHMANCTLLVVKKGLNMLVQNPVILSIHLISRITKAQFNNSLLIF